MIHGFEIYQYTGNPLFSSAGSKQAYGAIPIAGDRKASVCFVVSQVVKKTGMTKQYFRDSRIDPLTQTNLLNYRHYFICMPLRTKFVAAIY